MALDFEEMRRIYRLEKSTARLVDVPEDFFAQLHALIEDERTKYFDSLKDLNATRARDFGNLKKLIDEWFLVREKKLLNNVLVSARLEEVDLAHMAAEEKKMFSAVFEALTAHRALTKKVLDANGDFAPITPIAPASIAPSLTLLQPKHDMGDRRRQTPATETESETLVDPDAVIVETPVPIPVRAVVTSPPTPAPAPSSSPSYESAPVRILSEIPSFVGTDMKEYGPYKTGQVVDLPGKIAQLFISRKLGENAN